jgi:hypothetical protein
MIHLSDEFALDVRSHLWEAPSSWLSSKLPMAFLTT